MKFLPHLDLRGLHAYLGASKYHWVNYSTEKLIESYGRWKAVQRGTELHNLAAECIRLKVKLPNTKNALNMFVNDAIGYRMESEQPLFYSPNSFGTADAISFKKNLLRIHDLKTGITRVSMKQLYVYAALFCLEYDTKPQDIEIELRIYQGNEVFIDVPESADILYIMNKIIEFDKEIEKLNKQME